MSKILVPQELQEKIVDLYQSGKTRKNIKQILSLDFGDSVIKRILLEHNIEIRTNPGALKGGRKKQESSADLQAKIIDLYVNKGYGLDKIINKLNLSFSTAKVKSILQDNNIHIRNYQEAKEIAEEVDLRKYSINDAYNFESHNGAWILGFCAADGYLPNTRGARNRVAITLSAIDIEVLKLIKQELNYSGPLYEYDTYIGDNAYPTASLTFNSKQIRKALESYGIINNKTFLLQQLPNLPKEYMLDYIRGFFDGDGTIVQHNKETKDLNMGITCANKIFIEQINQYLHDNLPLKYKGSISKDHNNWCIRWGYYDSVIIGKAMYDNDYLALPRKKEKFYKLLSLREQLPRA